MLTGKQKRYLRAQAHQLKPIFQIGKDGVSHKQASSINEALKAKELIKVRLLQTCPQTANEAALEIAAQTKADVIQIVGRVITLYKRSDKVLYKLP
ncbi:MAG TPA: ribosome assembly RNA-binding protein YhbY [Erysipelotrichaceae bacterium]|nr:ribosome assembly RNA-binding protein YhbY [Erysipelotrichaceae bacterium]